MAGDAWTNRLLEPLGAAIPLVTMQEQVTYFKPDDPAAFDSALFPVWIWEDTHCFYGFPAYGEPTIKAARDVSDQLMTPEERTFVPAPELIEQLTSFLGGIVPGRGVPLRTVTCQYALTAGHGFKFTPGIGRILAELAIDGGTADDISGFVAPA